MVNKKINDNQCTICWYVDHTKISHKDATVVQDTIALLEKDFGKMTVKRGKKHVFVGMNIEITDGSSILIDMKDYLQ